MVFGGSGAIGAQICESLIEEGCQISFTYFSNFANAKRLQETLQCDSQRVDVRNPLEIKQAVHEASANLGGLDAVIQAVGIPGPLVPPELSQGESLGPIDGTTADDLNEFLAINTKSTFFICQNSWPYLKSSENPNLLILGSMDGVKMLPSPVHFSLSKAALKGLTESLAKELGAHNIKVNQIAPGILDGGQSTRLSARVKESYIEHCSLRRIGTIQEIAEVAVWFALENTYVTGQSILLDGGL